MKARPLLLALLWGAPFLIIAWLAWPGPERVQGVAFEVYREASRAWWARAPLYDLKIITGFVYLPQAAIVDTPFALLGAKLGPLAWRAAGWALYFTGLRRFVAPHRFLLLSLLAIPPAISSLVSSQASLHLAGFMLHAAADLQLERWWRVTAWAMVGLAVKPLMVVPLLLIWPLHRPLWWRIPIGLLGFCLLPFLTAPPAYVKAQLADARTKLRMADRPDEIFEDVRGMLCHFGWLIPPRVYLAVRGIAAGVTLGAALAARRLRAPLAVLSLFAAAAAYLMLFNPRTQSSTYVVVTPFAAWAAVHCFAERRRALGYALVAVLACWCISSRRGPAFAAYWTKPMACLVFCALFMMVAQRSGNRFTSESTHAPSA